MADNMTELTRKTLVDIRGLLAARQVAAREAVQACLARIEATEPKVQALLHVDAEGALATAEAMDKIGPDTSKPLWGVPVIVKDVLTTKGLPTTCGSRMLENFVPPFDATAVAKLKDAGAIILAKANMDEFAMGSSTENSAYHPTRNPWDLGRVPGGSSGGSGACVAAGQAFAALGTDTGGSIRLPSSFCGGVGIKPTYGRVSRYGLVAYGSSLDQIGPMTRNVADAATVLQAISGHDPRDSTSMDLPVPDYLAAVDSADGLKGLRIGMPKEYWGQGLDQEVETLCKQAMDTAKSLGAELVPVSLPHTEYAIATYYIIAMAEASSNLARFDGVRYGFRDKQATSLLDMYKQSRTKGFGDEVQRRIITGTYVLSSGYYDAYYRKAAQVRRLIRQDFEQAYSQCDVICGPACPTVAFPLGDKTADPLQMYLMDIFTISLNLAGLPGLSLPVGLGKDSGMPVGLQILGPAWGEEKILSVARSLEKRLEPLPEPRALA
ncbi:Asp-tRNA(Asn)/Glu-tRNA(Gln) amidotransferase subunit GatA [Desulfocurvibacter africanus]|uniref:Glutamyl-tRNA(Gln) amidotransferase subunit A n=1 Tax=Desulfocurvibacter africanus subsp. africanus str. Walvis Bay TaxID=690850 RepID=F3Z402_DESAF|nr:Asp-tRNA(Asn)/Glu-tRNA(Gln) amidotransferase subunit GatA [Desulfocurvibacter africanus]EGJ50454.1 Glutamyl-tRNA(Gln) amidotransferase subunit A [Desulfocurvibacter africanus subsp. africanus str. Walvis Bay]